MDKITAKSNENGEISRKQKEENRTSIGSLSWLAKQTRPDLQFSVSQAQKKQANPSAEDLKKTNKLVDQAAALRLNGVKIKKIPEQEIFFVTFHDAAWGNVDREDPDIGSPDWTGEHPVSSQLAHVILICGATLVDGEESDFSLIDWPSKFRQRVCRSTFAGETMACCKPWSIPSTCVPFSFPLQRDAWFKRKTVAHTFPFIASQTAKTSMTAS